MKSTTIGSGSGTHQQARLKESKAAALDRRRARQQHSKVVSRADTDGSVVSLAEEAGGRNGRTTARQGRRMGKRRGEQRMRARGGVASGGSVGEEPGRCGRTCEGEQQRQPAAREQQRRRLRTAAAGSRPQKQRRDRAVGRGDGGGRAAGGPEQRRRSCYGWGEGEHLRSDTMLRNELIYSKGGQSQPYTSRMNSKYEQYLYTHLTPTRNFPV